MTRTGDREMGIIDTLDELAELVGRAGAAGGAADDLYIRWSRGPDADLSDAHPADLDPPDAGPRAPDAWGGARRRNGGQSVDALTGVVLPGLSANPLRVEPWWGDRPLRLWVARRLYDYRHLRDLRGPGVRPWILAGEQRGRGPDNEPLVACHRAVAWVSERALRECEAAVDAQNCDEWGPLNRAR